MPHGAMGSPSGTMGAGVLPSAGASSTFLGGGNGPAGRIGLVLGGGTGPRAEALSTSASAGANVEEEEGKETAAYKGSEKDVKGSMEWIPSSNTAVI
ncbi:hypothetical protein CPC08DRAFT_763746 [Agrocybe pediades]|nr:hypothetical protein CPC08DRAFT_763746 [Agrocybe pediades]